MSTPRSALRHNGYTGSAEVSVEDGCMHGRILHIDDIVTYEGQTVPELAREFAAAVDRYLAHCRAIGKSPDKPYSGSLNVRLGPDLHRAAAEYASENEMNLNEAICKAVGALVSDPPQVARNLVVTLVGSKAAYLASSAPVDYPNFDASVVHRSITVQTSPTEPKVLTH